MINIIKGEELMEYKGFTNKLSAIITVVSLVIVLVGTSIGSFNTKSREKEGEFISISETSQSYEIDLVEGIDN